MQPRDPERFASDAAAIGPEVTAKTLAEAAKADIIFLAVRYQSHPDIAKALPSWPGKIIVDMANASGVPDEALTDSRPQGSSRGPSLAQEWSGLQPSGCGRP